MIKKILIACVVLWSVGAYGETKVIRFWPSIPLDQEIKKHQLIGAIDQTNDPECVVLLWYQDRHMMDLFAVCLNQDTEVTKRTVE